MTTIATLTSNHFSESQNGLVSKSYISHTYGIQDPDFHLVSSMEWDFLEVRSDTGQRLKFDETKLLIQIIFAATFETLKLSFDSQLTKIDLSSSILEDAMHLLSRLG